MGSVMSEIVSTEIELLLAADYLGTLQPFTHVRVIISSDIDLVWNKCQAII